MTDFDIEKIKQQQKVQPFIDKLVNCNIPKGYCRGDVGLQAVPYGDAILESYFTSPDDIKSNWRLNFQDKCILNFWHPDITVATEYLILSARTLGLKFADLYYANIFDYLHMDWDTTKDVEAGEILCISEFYNSEWSKFPELKENQQNYFQSLIRRFITGKSKILLISTDAPIVKNNDLYWSAVYPESFLEFLRKHGKDEDLESGIRGDQQGNPAE